MYDIYDNDFDKAFDEAVDAIEKKEHRLIWADALKKAMEHRLVCYPLYAKMPLAYGETDMAEIIDAQPTVEAEPRKHGRWIEVQRINPTDRMAICECSICGDTVWVYDGQRTWNYCPNCGARMDGGENG